MKDIKDYLPLYLGQKIQWTNPNQYISRTLAVGPNMVHTLMPHRLHDCIMNPDTFKLLLRPLSSMTEEEMKMIDLEDKDFLLANLEFGNELNLSSEHFVYLLSKGFDLFGLIESGHALDLTTVKV